MDAKQELVLMEERILMLRLKHGNNWPEVKAWDEAHGGPPTEITVAVEDLETARSRVESAETALVEAKKEEGNAARRLEEARTVEAETPPAIVLTPEGEGGPPPLPPGETIDQDGTGSGN